MNTKLISILIFFVISFSSISYTHAETLPLSDGLKNDIPNNFVKSQENTKASNAVSIDLSENIGMSSGDEKPSDHYSEKYAGYVIRMHKQIDLFDNVTIIIPPADQDFISLAKVNFDNVAMMERITNNNKIRFDGKSIITNEILWTDQNKDDVFTTLYLTELGNQIQNAGKHYSNILSSWENLSVDQITNFVSTIDNPNSYLKITNSFENDISNGFHSVSVQYPTLLVFLIPISGYILIRSENEQLRIKNSRQILSSFFIIILLSSTVVTPLSISGNYWWLAFADNNSTGNIVKSSLSSTSNSTKLPVSSNSTKLPVSSNSTKLPVSSNSTKLPVSSNSTKLPVSSNSTKLPVSSNSTKLPVSSNSTKLPVSSNSTKLPVSSNSTKLPVSSNSTKLPVSSNSTKLPVSSNSTKLPVSSNSTKLPVSSNSTGPSLVYDNLPLSDSIQAFQPKFSNGTYLVILRDGVSIVDSNQNMQNLQKIISSLPNATKSFNFTSSKGTVGNTQVTNQTLQLQGQGYVLQNVNSTNSLKQLTISASVLPDYSQGSPVFTVVSKENQFSLTVNNILPPQQTAQFSVFDGIKWNKVNSTIPILNWTHLAATYNGTDIALFVNGTMQSSLRLQGIPTLTNDGNLKLKTPDQISSNSDVVIGAAIDSVRNNAKDKFSGQIRDVSLYDTLLDQSQIKQLYLKLLQSINPPAQTPDNLVNMSDNLSMTDSIQAFQPKFTNGTNLVALGDILSMADTINYTSINETALAVVPSIQTMKSSDALSENPEFDLQIFKNADMKKLQNITINGNATIQQGRWADKNTAITVKIMGPNGTEIPIKSEFTKLKEGKFHIKLLTNRYGNPGLYTLKTTLVENGKTYTTKSQYAWGLVSLNTNKSIYRPGESANMTIVVLDNGGHSVCNSNILMNVTDPNGHSSIMYSGNGITPESQCGLYDAKYTTISEGNYTVNVTAQNPSGTTNFNTSFLVSNSYPFDIIRTTASKIDPVDNPNLFNVKIDATSFVGSGPITIREYVPSVFDVKTDGKVKTVGDTKILTWDKNLIGNKTFVKYSYSVPLVYPQLYTLGSAEIHYGLNQTFTEARPWYVAVDPTVLAYIPVTLTNTVSSTSTPTNFQQEITWNPSNTKLKSLEASDLGNIRFCSDSACNTQLYGWLESGNSTSASNAVAWVKIPTAIVMELHLPYTWHFYLKAQNMMGITGG